MSKRLVSKTIRPDGTGFKVYRLVHWNEWVTEFYLRGVKHNGADYHTDTQADATDTGKYWLRQREDRPERHMDADWARQLAAEQDAQS